MAKKLDMDAVWESVHVKLVKRLFKTGVKLKDARLATTDILLSTVVKDTAMTQKIQKTILESLRDTDKAMSNLYIVYRELTKGIKKKPADFPEIFPGWDEAVEKGVIKLLS
jgi:hypothetical protein